MVAGCDPSKGAFSLFDKLNTGTEEVPFQRRRKTARERREQDQRAQARHMLYLLKTLQSVKVHRGNSLGSLGATVLTALQGVEDATIRGKGETNHGKDEAKGGLENYCSTLLDKLAVERLQEKLEAGGKERIEFAVQNASHWLEKNQLAEKVDFETKRKELEGVVNPIMMKVYDAVPLAALYLAELPQESVDLLAQKAENSQAMDDESLDKVKVKAKSDLESCCRTIRQKVTAQQLREKIEVGDLDKIESAVQGALHWLGQNQFAEKGEFEAQKKELEGVVHPVMMKVYDSVPLAALLLLGDLLGRRVAQQQAEREGS